MQVKKVFENKKGNSTHGDSSPLITNEGTGNTTTVNYTNVPPVSWVGKKRAAEKINSQFEGFLFQNIPTLSTHSSEENRTSYLNVYRKALKGHVEPEISKLDAADQKEIVAALDEVTSTGMPRIEDETFRRCMVDRVCGILEKYMN